MADDLTHALELYEDAISATREQRTQIEEDLRFSDPSDPQQWDDKVRIQRETDPGGSRPCLVMDHTGQYVANVAGQVNRAPPSIHTVPVGSGADIKVSEQLDGMLRHIEYASRAQTAYGVALTSAARTGVGYLVVRPQYVDRAMGYQEPRISAEADPLRVVFDPWSVQLDGNDSNFGYLLTSLSEREFERRWPKAEKCSFGSSARSMDGANERKSIVIAEQWYKEEKTRNIIIWTAVDGEKMSGSEDEYFAACQAAGFELEFNRNYKDKYQCVKWRTLSGAAVLDTPKDADGKEALYPADSIGIVPVYGYWGISDGRMTYCGIPRRAMNPQRAYNYHMSEQLAHIGTAPKSPWIASVRAIAGLETIWDRASLDSRAYLPFNDVDETGAPIAMPQRMNLTVNLQSHIAGAEQALHDLEASIGMYQANLGAPSNEQSGVAIDARKEQGEASTSHFPQNLAASLGQVGRIVVQMSARLIDTKRQQRILGIDMTPGAIIIDPEQEAAVQDTDKGVSINPNVGSYDVRVVVGASYVTQRSQGQTALAEVMRNNPEMTPAIAPLWAQNLDIPHADKLAQVLTAMAPPAVQAILNPDTSKKPKVEQLLQQVEQAQGALQEAIQHAHEAQQEADEAQQQLQDKSAEIRVKEAELKIKAYDSATKRLQTTSTMMTPEQVKLMVAETIEAMLSHPDPLPSEEAPAEPQELELEPMEEEMPPPEPEPQMQFPEDPPSAGFSLPDPPQGA
jgi:hypothetical protein